MVFSGLSPLVIEDVADEGEVIGVSARTRDIRCLPGVRAPTGRVHGFHWRTVADVPVDGRRVVVSVRVRRLVCPVLGCPRQTFREQVPGVRGAIPAAHRSSGRQLKLRGQGVSGPGGRPSLPRTGLRDLPLDRPAHAHAQALPAAARPARARRRRLRPETPAPLRHRDHRRRDRRADRRPARPHRPDPGSVAARASRGRVVCRDGSASYGEAIRQALPEAVQVSDRWQCATRRFVVSPIQPGGTWREVLGSDGLPGSER